MRQKDLKYFADPQSGRLNSDDSPFAITPNEWVNSENIRSGTTDKGHTGVVESIGGNILLNQAFPSVTIGSQEWMLSNLDVSYYKNGDAIPQENDPIAWAALTTGAWCYYANDPRNEQSYGKLYNAYAVNDPRGLAPEEWHIPSQTEIQTLSTFLGGDAISGGKLKDIGTSFWISPNTGATNSSGFTARGAGYRDPSTGIYSLLDENTAYWTSTNDSPTANFFGALDTNSTNFDTSTSEDNRAGFSIRCIKDLNQYITIGTIEDTENKRICYFQYDDSAAREDKIVCIYTETNTIYNVLLSSQVIGGLNFDKYSLIHSARIIDSILSWTDSTNNEPRKINIESAMLANYPTFVTDQVAYSFPLDFFEITVIKPPPIYCPNIVKTIDTTYANNFIYNHSFEFAFQYQYYDNETTVVGSYSVASRFSSADSDLNLIIVSMDGNEIIPSTVKKVKLIARRTNGETQGGSDAFVARVWDKDSIYDLAKIENQNNSITALSFNFFNNLTGQVLAPDDVLRPFDNVPIYSQTHEVAKNRYFFGNNTDGYDTPTTSSLSVSLSHVQLDVDAINTQIYALTFRSIDGTVGDAKRWAFRGLAIFDGQNYYLLLAPGAYNYTYGDTTLPPLPIVPASPITYNSTSMISIGNTIGDMRRRICPALSGVPNIQTVSNASNIGTTVTVTSTIGLFVGAILSKTAGGGALAANTKVVSIIDNTHFTINNIPTTPLSGATLQAVPSTTGYIYTQQQDLKLLLPEQWITVNNFNTPSYGVFPQISPYKFGVVFYDYAMRKCGVIDPVDSDDYTQIYSYYSTPTYITNVMGTATNEITTGLVNQGILLPGDKITIEGTPITALNDTFTVDHIQANQNKIFTVETTVPTTINYTSASDPVVITVSRRLRSDVTTPFNSATNAVSAFGWRLSNSPVAGEIPDWAYYYTVVRTLNLRTRYFIQTSEINPKYATRKPDGTLEFVTTLVGNTNPLVGIGLPTDNLRNNGLGYVYEEVNDDQCILKANSLQAIDPLVLPVIGQEGNYIIVKWADLGNASGQATSTGGLVNMSINYEIYHPYKPVDQEPYYEVGEIYKILNPGTISKAYEIVAGNYRGDCAKLSTVRIGMCANDKYYKRWDNDGGKLNVVTTYGQSVNTNYVTWSDAVISGTQINGTSTFRSPSYTIVPLDCGSITKLQLTSKIQNEGTVMLSLCTEETNSMYLGETQITDSTGGTQFFSAGSSVIGTINTLKGNYGCISPESVVQYRGRVFFFDANAGRWVQYSENGLDAISSIKMVRFWKNWAAKYLSMTKTQIEDLGDRPYIFAAVDASHDELLISIPKLSNTPPKGFLPDYPEVPYPFDMLDFQGKTIVYKLGSLAVAIPHWQSAYTFTTEYFATIQNRLFSFKNGLIYEHNQSDLQNNFYDTQYSSSIMCVSNVSPQTPKTYDNIVSESSIIPTFCYFYNEFPYIQSSDLIDSDFVNKEGIWYSNILRNKIVPTSIGFTTDGLLSGELMRNTNMYVWMQYSPTNTPLELKLVQLGFTISKGHTI